MNPTTSTPSVGERAVRENATAATTPEPGTAERLAFLRVRPVVSIAEAGELTGLSRSSILRAISSGDLSARKVNRRVLIPTANLLGFVGAGEAVA